MNKMLLCKTLRCCVGTVPLGLDFDGRAVNSLTCCRNIFSCQCHDRHVPAIAYVSRVSAQHADVAVTVFVVPRDRRF
jgi:hypothetical protein